MDPSSAEAAEEGRDEEAQEALLVNVLKTTVLQVQCQDGLFVAIPHRFLTDPYFLQALEHVLQVGAQDFPFRLQASSMFYALQTLWEDLVASRTQLVFTSSDSNAELPT